MRFPTGTLNISFYELMTAFQNCNVTFLLVKSVDFVLFYHAPLHVSCFCCDFCLTNQFSTLVFHSSTKSNELNYYYFFIIWFEKSARRHKWQFLDNSTSIQKHSPINEAKLLKLINVRKFKQNPFSRKHRFVALD